MAVQYKCTAANPTTELETTLGLCIKSMKQNSPRAADMKLLRVLITYSQKPHSELSDAVEEKLFDLITMLLLGLASNEYSLQDQLLSSTTMFVLMDLLPSPHHEVIGLSLSCLGVSDQTSAVNPAIRKIQHLHLPIKCAETFLLVLCHGLLQCSHTFIMYSKNITICNTLFRDIYSILEKACKKYSRLTFIAFKTLTKWLDKVRDMKMTYCVDNVTAKTIFAIVNNSWESPINGVRKENSRILELLLDICNNNNDASSVEENNKFAVVNLLPTILQEQPWKMKSKYFMLAILLPKYGVVRALMEYPDLAAALVSTVQHSHLASAGCNVYKACLKNLHQKTHWYQFFLAPVLHVLSEDTDDDVGKQNLYNYWLSTTVQIFPDVLWELLKQLVELLETTNHSVLLSVISLIHLGRKEGLINDLWESNWVVTSNKSLHLNILNNALQHSNETIRNHAFAAVCVCAKTSLFPSEQEIQTVQKFLLENANADSPPLRQGILNSFITFLLRLRDSFLLEMKNVQQKKGTSSGAISSLHLMGALNFIKWLHSFCLLNLEPGTNYQRKILSLNLYQEVLKYLGGSNTSAVEKKHGLKRKGGLHGNKIKEFAVQYKMWSFDSEASQQCMLACLMDPTDDIREMASSILVEYFNQHDRQSHVKETETLMRKALNLCSSSMFYETESGALMVKVVAGMVDKGSQTDTAKSNVIKHLISNLAHEEPQVQTRTFEPLMAKEQFAGLNYSLDFFEQTSSQVKLDETVLSSIHENIPTTSGSLDIFSTQAAQLLAALHQHCEKKENTLHIPKRIAHIPGTYEGLVVQDPNEIAFLSGTEVDTMAKTFEGLTVVHPSSGEVGQHLNVSHPKMYTKETRPKKNAKQSTSLPKREWGHEEWGEYDVWLPEKKIINHKPKEQSMAVHNTRGSSTRPPLYPAMPNTHLHLGSNMKESVSSKPFSSGKKQVHFQPIISTTVRKNPFSRSTVDSGIGKERMMKHYKSGRESNKAYHTQNKITQNQCSWENELPNIFEREIQNPVDPQKRESSSQERFSVSPVPSLDWDHLWDPPSLSTNKEQRCKNCGKGESCKSFLGLLLCRGWTQWQALQEDVYHAALLGSPLHGLLTAMTQLIVQSSHVTQNEIEQMVHLIEDVVHHLLGVLASKSSNTQVAPSFAEMSEAIESAIQQSFSSSDDCDEQVSAAHQLILNCTWLNLKASCMLACELAKDYRTSAVMVNRCMQVIIKVLLRCRHKGAIEAAGTALGNFVKAVTGGGEHRVLHTEDGLQIEVKQLAGTLLVHFLESLQTGDTQVSTTRRSAGLAILVHKIVANDRQPGKPVLELCMSQLLCMARMPLEDIAKLEQMNCDLPQAQALHFLRTLMQDSELRQHMASYVSDTALICFDNFLSPIWTIRNAALQLFGSLVPKLVGEKKFQDNDTEGYGNITIEEFFSHFPELVEFLLTSLSNIAMQQHPSLVQHSSLVPVLSLLSKMCIGGYSLMEDSLKQTVHKFMQHFNILLSSEIFAVRKISAKAYARFVPISRIGDNILKFVRLLIEQRPPENALHGHLLVLKYLKERLENDGTDLVRCKFDLGNELSMLHKISYINSLSWLNKSLIVELSGIGFMETKEGKHASTLVWLRHALYVLMVYTSQGKINPGIQHWARVELELSFRKCPQEYFTEVWQCTYNSNWDDICVDFLSILKYRLHQEKEIKHDTRYAVFHALLDVVAGIQWLKSNDLLFQIYNTMLILATEHSVGRNIDPITIQMFLIQNNKGNANGLQCWSIVLPLACALVVAQDESIELQLMDHLAYNVRERTSASDYDEKCRFDAAKGFHLLYETIFTSVFKNTTASPNNESIGQEIIKKILDAGLAFLQDEDSDVRKEASKFAKNYLSTKQHALIHPYTCLERLINFHSLLAVLPLQEAMVYLCSKLDSLEDCKKVLLNSVSFESDDMVSTSPFDHGTSNIYAEEVVVINLLRDNLLFLIERTDESMKSELDDLICVNLIEEDLNVILTAAFNANKYGRLNSTARAALHVIGKKLLYILQVKLALRGNNLTELQHLIVLYNQHHENLTCIF